MKPCRIIEKKLISATHLPIRATNHYIFANQPAGGLGLQDPVAEVHVQKVIQAIKMLNCRDQNVKIVVTEQLQYSFHHCLPTEPTNENYEEFLSGSTEGPFKNYTKLGNVKFIWTGVSTACRFLCIKITNFEGNVGVQYDKSRVKEKPTTLTGSLRELVKEFHTTKFLSKPDQGKAARSLIQDQYSNGSLWFFLGYGIRFCDWRFIQ